MCVRVCVCVSHMQACLLYHTTLVLYSLLFLLKYQFFQARAAAFLHDQSASGWQQRLSTQ